MASTAFDAAPFDRSARPLKRHQIDHRTIKLIVGIVAIGIGPLTGLLSRLNGARITSISASYYAGAPAQTVFVGFLFAVGALLAAYNGYTNAEMVLSKIAAAAALLVALFPCGCDGRPEVLPHAHAASATALFLILAYFAFGFFQRARTKAGPAAMVRQIIYAACCLAILGAIAVLALHGGFNDKPSEGHSSRIVYWGEFVALLGFGISWLTASHFVPGITSRVERAQRKQSVN